MKRKWLKNQEILVLFQTLEAEQSETVKKRLYWRIYEGASYLPEKLARARKYHMLQSYQDILQVGKMTLYKAVLSFDSTKCPNFIGWAYPWIKKTMALTARSNIEFFDTFELHGDWTELAEAFAGDEDPEGLFISKEVGNIVHRSLRKTNPNAQSVIAGLFDIDTFDADSLLGVSNKNNLSRRRLMKLRDAAFEQLRNNPEMQAAAL